MSGDVSALHADYDDNISSTVWRNMSNMSISSDNISDVYIPLCNFMAFQVQALIFVLSLMFDKNQTFRWILQ